MPGEVTLWTALMAGAAGVSVNSVQRIWRAHALQPHRIRQCKLSRDLEFVDKAGEVVGPYVDPPARAVVLSVDEKYQIEALEVALNPPSADFIRPMADAPVRLNRAQRPGFRSCRRRSSFWIPYGFAAFDAVRSTPYSAITEPPIRCRPETVEAGGAALRSPYLDLAMLSLVTEAAPKSISNSTFCPRSLHESVHADSNIFAGNCATDASSTPAARLRPRRGRRRNRPVTYRSSFAFFIACAPPAQRRPRAE